LGGTVGGSGVSAGGSIANISMVARVPDAIMHSTYDPNTGREPALVIVAGSGVPFAGRTFPPGSPG
jgi:hypothetical protein